MQYSNHWIAVFWRTSLASVALLAMAGLTGARSASGQDSPIAALEAMNKTILEAESIDEILQFIPEEAHDFISQLPPEQKAAGLAEEKARVGRQKYVAERVAGDHAVVVAVDASGESDMGVRFIKMSRVDGKWKMTGDEEYLVSTLVGASGSYSVSGAVSAELEDGMITIAATTIEIADLAEENLGDGSKVARVKIPFPAESQLKCFEPGKMSIGTVVEEGEYSYTLHGGFIPAGAEIEQGFYRDMTGTLEVVPGEEDHFSGNYEFTASNDAGETVTVSGRIDRALMPCFGTPEDSRK